MSTLLPKTSVPRIHFSVTLKKNPDTNSQLNSLWEVRVPKRVIGSAVRRNRMKRVVKAALNVFIQKIRPDLGGIVTVRSSPPQIILQNVSRELDMIFKKMGAIRTA